MGEQKMVSSEKIKFQIKRTAGFLKIFMKNPKGIFGVVIITFFGILALAPQLLTPYNPITDRRLSGSFAAPSWLRTLPPILGGNPYLSENMKIIDDPNFGKRESLNEWTLTTNQGIIIQWGQGPTIPNPYSDPGAIQVTFRREQGESFGNVTAIIYKEFSYPYMGPPSKFMGAISLFVNGTATNVTISVPDTSNLNVWPIPYKNITQYMLDAPVNVQVFIARKDGEEWSEWKVWPTPGFKLKGADKEGTFFNFTNEWVTSLTGYTLTSETPEIVNMFRSQFHNKDPIQVIFERAKLPTQFRFGVKLTFIDTNATKSLETNVFIDNLDLRLYGTSWGLLGTDNEGRDLFAQLVYGARISLYVGLLSAILSVIIGLIVGLVSGYLGGIIDEILMRFSDMLLVLPTLPLLMILVSVLGARIENLILLLGILGWMGFARVVRSQVLSLKERPFVEAAKAIGAGKTHIIFRHILPNVMPLVYVTLATTVPGSIVAEAALSWLGFADPMRMSWGRMLHEVQANSAYMCWWWIIPPGLCIALVAMAFILLGYALDEVLNPRLRTRR